MNVRDVPKRRLISIIWLSICIMSAPIINPLNKSSATAFTSTSEAIPSSGSSGKIAFLSEENGKDAIYVATVDGSAIHRITTPNFSIDDFDWSPDGKLIALASKYGGCSRLYIMNSDGSNLRPILADSRLECAGLPRWSPDSKQLAFVGSTTRNSEDLLSLGNNIYVLTLSSSLLRSVFSSFAYYPSLTWSPDGKQIGFTSNSGANLAIWIKSVDSFETEILDRDGSSYPLHDVLHVAWSPSGKHFAFASTRGEIYRVNIDGGDLRLLTKSGYYPRWSPDGRYIAFASQDKNTNHIYVMNVDGSNVHRLTTRNISEWLPTWLP